MILSLDDITGQYAAIVHALCLLADSYFFLGQREKALGLLREGVGLLRDKEVAPHDQAQLLLSYGKMISKVAFATGGSFAEAFTQLSTARMIAETLHDDVLVADTLNELGEAHFYRGHYLTWAEDDYNTAQACFQQSLGLYESTYNERGICTSLFNSGRSYQNAGQHGQAAPVFQSALGLAERSQYTQLQAELLVHLGILALVKGDQETARAQIVDALALRQEIGARCDLAYSHLALAEVCHSQGDLVTALVHYQQCYTLAEEMHQHNVICAVPMCLGYIHLDEKRLEQAREFFNEAYFLSSNTGLVGGIQEAFKGLVELTQS